MAIPLRLPGRGDRETGRQGDRETGAPVAPPLTVCFCQPSVTRPRAPSVSSSFRIFTPCLLGPLAPCLSLLRYTPEVVEQARADHLGRVRVLLGGGRLEQRVV